MSSSDATDRAAVADKLKLEGNALFHKQDYEGACQKYTKAIEQDPKNAIFYSNRAAAYLAFQPPQLVFLASFLNSILNAYFQVFGCCQRLRTGKSPHSAVFSTLTIMNPLGCCTSSWLCKGLGPPGRSSRRAYSVSAPSAVFFTSLIS